MQPSELYLLLLRIDELFPLPRNAIFQGHHHIVLVNGCPVLGLWYSTDGENIFHKQFNLSVGGTIEDQLINIKNSFQSGIKIEPTTPTREETGHSPQEDTDSIECCSDE